MKKKYKFGVIGAGFMATSIVKGCLGKKKLLPKEIIVSDVNGLALEKISKLGVNVTENNNELVSQSEYVLFAVKPQSLDNVLNSINDCSCEKIISIMAGIKRSRLKQKFVCAKVARCMPNTPCSIGAGAVGIDLTDFTEENDVEFIKDLFKSFANVVVLSEDKMNAVTGVSGSSPAYFYLFLKSVIEAGVINGLSFEEARDLATSTMIGAGKMVKNNKSKSLDELIEAVCSKGGTTIEAINVFKQEGIENITLKAVNACVKRASELENI